MADSDEPDGEVSPEDLLGEAADIELVGEVENMPRGVRIMALSVIAEALGLDRIALSLAGNAVAEQPLESLDITAEEIGEELEEEYDDE